MRLITCQGCGLHHYQSDSNCPHCNLNRRAHKRAPTAMALLLGIGLTACGDKDTGSEPSSEPTAEPSGEPEYGVAEPAAEPEYGVAEPGAEMDYGVPMTDNDGDGYFAEEDDCNDDDATINPGATETPDDGIDSNCNGDDNT